MPAIPTPILIFGDHYVSKNNITALKKKYPEYQWVTKSASTDTLNSIRTEAGLTSWDDKETVLLIQDLPNKKQVRDFIINLASSCPNKTKLIIWDSLGHIKVDPKDKTIDKTWSEFVQSFKGVKDSRVVNNGETLTEKQGADSVDFVVRTFEKYEKQIGTREAKILISIVGYDRGMLESDIKKMILTCPSPVTSQFIIENAFPTTKEAIFYKMGNVLDDGSFEEAINLMEKFLSSGTHPNQIAELIVKKARWQMVVAYLWHSGSDWASIPNKLMDMGKFPSAIWHNDQIDATAKRREAEALQIPENMVKYMVHKEGIPVRYFKPVADKATPKGKTAMARKNAEVVPMYFQAEQTVNFVRDRIVRRCNLPPSEVKVKLLNRAIAIYLLTQEKLAEVRYGENPEQDLQEMVRAMISTGLDRY